MARDVEARLFKLAAEQTKDYALFMLDPGGHIITWNIGAQRMKGYTPDQIIGKHFSVFYTREALETGWPDYELRVASTEGRFEDEGWRVRKDGSRFWASVVITALRDANGKLLAFSKITRDLTERKLHEEALRQSEERFRLMVEGVVDYAIYMLDPEGIVTSWNAGAQRLTGYTREEMIGKHFSRFYAQEDIDLGKPWAELAMARSTGRSEGEAWRVRKTGERFWARVVVSALHDAEGRLRGFAKVTQDLSERRHLQDLEKAARNVNEFIATLAHELRNPLAPIRTAVEAMAHLPTDAPARESMRLTIDRQSAHLARIVDDLLDITRITRGALTLNREPLELADVVRRAVEVALPAIEGGAHTLEVDLPDAPLCINGDADRLTQILGNLLNNAARYTRRGGKITVQGRAEDNRAVLRVRDTGQGIDPKLIGRIFDMFVQGPALERVGAGLGIGLAVARRLTEMHGGTLEAHSEGQDQGSEFTVRLPLLDKTQSFNEKRVHPHAIIPATQTPRRVLIVDDNVDAAMALDLLLRSLGHETCAVHDGTRALEMATQFHPEVVLLDIGMPGVDGYEVARRLRALPLEHPLRIVAVTGWGQEADRERSRDAGFDLHLVKPVDTRELVDVLGDRGSATLH